MALPFSTPPTEASLTPFKVSIPKAKISELQTLLQVAKFAPHTYENSQVDRRYGVGTDWLVTMRDLWLRSYSWWPNCTLGLNITNILPGKPLRIESTPFLNL